VRPPGELGSFWQLEAPISSRDAPDQVQEEAAIANWRKKVHRTDERGNEASADENQVPKKPHWHENN